MDIGETFSKQNYKNTSNTSILYLFDCVIVKNR